MKYIPYCILIFAGGLFFHFLLKIMESMEKSDNEDYGETAVPEKRQVSPTREPGENR